MGLWRVRSREAGGGVHAEALSELRACDDIKSALQLQQAACSCSNTHARAGGVL